MVSVEQRLKAIGELENLKSEMEKWNLQTEAVENLKFALEIAINDIKVQNEMLIFNEL